MVTKKVKKKVAKKKTTSAQKSEANVKAAKKFELGVAHLIGAGIIVIIIATILAVLTSGFQDWSFDDKPTLELYVMSQCPYGVQAEDAILPAMKDLGNDIELKVDYIATNLGDGNFDSLHGMPEVLGNIAQLCVKEHDNENFIDFVLCMNKNAKAIPQNWQSCSESLELDTPKIAECYAGDEGKELLADSLERAESAGASGSPTIFVNGEAYKGARDGFAISQLLCDGVDSTACDALPECKSNEHCTAESDMVGVCNAGTCSYQEPVEVIMYLLNDEQCTDCDTGKVMQYMTTWFKGLIVEDVDVNSEFGQELVNELGLVYAPSYVFVPSITDTYMWKSQPQLRNYFTAQRNYFTLNNNVVAATWFVDEEKKAAWLSDLGVTTGDNKPQVDFFVMSYCPYGNLAEEALFPVYQSLGDAVEFKPHYIYYPEYQGGGSQFCMDSESQYCSMHGVQEANQNVRELCVLEEYGIEAWFDFSIAMNSACNYENADSCWTAVASDLGYDAAKVESCFESDKLIMGAADLEASTKFGASGSPTVFIDGGKYGGERSAAGYQSAICGAFEDAPAECANMPVVTTAARAAPAPSAGACGA